MYVCNLTLVSSFVEFKFCYSMNLFSLKVNLPFLEVLSPIHTPRQPEKNSNSENHSPKPRIDYERLKKNVSISFSVFRIVVPF